MVILTLILLAVFIGLAIWALWQFSSVDRGMVIQRLDNETSRLATTLVFNKMTAFAQLAIALLGGLWAFLSLADTIVKIKGWTTIMCFVLVNLSFVSSLGLYACGYDFIAGKIFYHASFDLDAPFVSFVKESQQLFFLNGCIDLGSTILLGRKMS
jgi:hypothetical protein